MDKTFLHTFRVRVKVQFHSWIEWNFDRIDPGLVIMAYMTQVNMSALHFALYLWSVSLELFILDYKLLQLCLPGSGDTVYSPRQSQWCYFNLQCDEERKRWREGKKCRGLVFKGQDVEVVCAVLCCPLSSLPLSNWLAGATCSGCLKHPLIHHRFTRVLLLCLYLPFRQCV